LIFTYLFSALCTSMLMYGKAKNNPNYNLEDACEEYTQYFYAQLFDVNPNTKYVDVRKIYAAYFPVTEEEKHVKANNIIAGFIGGLAIVPYGKCKGTNRYNPVLHYSLGDEDSDATSWAERYIRGNIAHYIIETFYNMVYGEIGKQNVELEYQIPFASAKNPKNSGYADIVNLTTREIFEIKGVKGWKYGDEEVGTYVQKARQYCNGVFIRGKIFPLAIKLPWITPTTYLQVYLHDQAKNGGVITYKVRELPPSVTVPETVPQPVPQYIPIYDGIKEMLKKPTPRGYEVPAGFCDQNPVLCQTIKDAAYGTAVVAGTVVVIAAGIAAAPYIAAAAATLATYEAVYATAAMIGVIISTTKD
jgi:hypothetical protein